MRAGGIPPGLRSCLGETARPPSGRSRFRVSLIDCSFCRLFSELKSREDGIFPPSRYAALKVRGGEKPSGTGYRGGAGETSGRPSDHRAPSRGGRRTGAPCLSF